MRILVYPHDLALGGSQLNAVELAAAVRDRGHDVVIYGRDGSLVERIEQLGLEFLAAPPASMRPSRSSVNALRSLVVERKVDVVHGYEWPPAIELCLAAAGTRAVPVATVMSMAVAPFIPRGLPLIVGTEQIAQAERGRGRVDVRVIEPPVDLGHNDPSLDLDLAGFRERMGLDVDSLVLCTVTRLAHELKLEGVLSAIEVVAGLPSTIQLLVVGDGPAAPEVRAAAARTNARAARRAVVLAGELVDPRPAYAVADVMLGMGGSALRALSFAKPLVVQGEQGFWSRLSPETVDQFLWYGWYGTGEGRPAGPARLLAEIEPLLRDAATRSELGRYGRELAESRFSLGSAAARQLEQYEDVLSSSPKPLMRSSTEAARVITSFAGHAVRRKWRRAASHHSARDDFNARPEARSRVKSGAHQPEHPLDAHEGSS